MNKNSPNSTQYRNARKVAKELYENGITDTKALARQAGVKEVTIKRWIKSGEWITKSELTKDLDDKIEKTADRVLLKVLEEYEKDPTSKDLQSMRGLLKEYMERRKPDRKILEYIIKFQDGVINFCIASGNDVLRKHYQAALMDLSEYFRKEYV